jgi:uncharacterized protein YecE (DUF72 family)
MILVGTSGWQYKDWRGPFYPPDVPQRLWLEHFAARFATVEINNAFYRLPERDTFAAWRARTPPDFCIAVKISRYLTHVRRLQDPAEPAARFMRRADALGDRPGPVLLQLPPTLHADPKLLAGTLKCFPATVRVAVEPRHPSWWTSQVRTVLERHGAALCWADRHSRPVTPLWRTTDWSYLRLHEGRARPWPHYGTRALRTWVERIADVYGSRPRAYVYFNNDPGAAAITDADAFARIADRHGMAVSRHLGSSDTVRSSRMPVR